jgi:hypothetical protein
LASGPSSAIWNDLGEGWQISLRLAMPDERAGYSGMYPLTPGLELVGFVPETKEYPWLSKVKGR